ncbi:DNA internalization-related competence protein ComEC/Rec2 [Denitratisoma sp. agr-D3]
MTTGIIAFALGIACLQWQATLPGWTGLTAAGALGVALCLPRACRRHRLILWGGAFLLGLAWAGLCAQQRMADALAEALEGRDVAVVGVVAAMPQRFENGWRFVFRVEQAPVGVPGLISLAWYQSRQLDEAGESLPLETVHAGERWRFTVRLKRPHGNLNPHGFDYEAWLLEQGLRATGYVRASAGYERLATFVPSPMNRIERWREAVRGRFEAILGDSPAKGVLVALAVGDQRGIAQSQWQDFSRTGLTHLFSVSGLHITLVAGLVYSLTAFFWRRSPRLVHCLATPRAAALAGMVTAWGYALLAGFAVPAQRTFYMLAVVAAALAARRTVASHQVLALALGVVLVLDPWAVLSAGFWLSFGAVALLFYVGSARVGEEPRGHGWLSAWGRAQWAMTAGMVPLLLALFQQFSLVSPLANAFAIPLVSFIITPLALAAMVPGLGGLLPLVAWLTDRLLDACHYLAASPWAVWQQAAPPPWALAFALPGVLWLLAPRGVPARWLGAVLCLPLFLLPLERPVAGMAKVVVLDVGQGLAVHVQTARHDLLFDTGPLFSPEANSGNRIIVPYLRAVGVTRLDGLVVSHADKDHSGGAASVLEAVSTTWMIHALPAHHELLAQASAARPCFDGQEWTWDGVHFSVLHPVFARHDEPTRKSNDMSCVLKVTTSSGSVLIPSDIEAASEAELLARHADLAADVLVVPHHGSRTSSTEAFITAVTPRLALFPVGYRNRFGHPKEDIVARYGAVAQGRTDFDGALTVTFDQNGPLLVREREGQRRYWHGR